MNGKKVLVIEDNPLNMKLVKQLLLIGKLETLEAGDAETGILLAKNSRPDLILMDIQLPGMNGLEAAHTIKSDPEMHTIPIIALTSFAMSGDDKKAMDAGCCGYISKPINTRSFLQEITQHLK